MLHHRFLRKRGEQEAQMKMSYLLRSTRGRSNRVSPQSTKSAKCLCESANVLEHFRTFANLHLVSPHKVRLCECAKCEGASIFTALNLVCARAHSHFVLWRCSDREFGARAHSHFRTSTSQKCDVRGHPNALSNGR